MDGRPISDTRVLNLSFIMMHSLSRRVSRALVFSVVVVAMTTILAREAAADVEVAGSLVRLRVRALEEGTQVRIYSLRADGSSPFLCATPCSEELPPGALLRMVLGEDWQDIQTYVVPNSPGQVVDLTVRLVDVVRPAPRSFLVGGIVALAFGATTIVAGALVYGSQRSYLLDSPQTSGAAIVGVGAVATVGGILLLAFSGSRVEARRMHLSAGAQSLGFAY